MREKLEFDVIPFCEGGETTVELVYEYNTDMETYCFMMDGKVLFSGDWAVLARVFGRALYLWEPNPCSTIS